MASIAVAPPAAASCGTADMIISGGDRHINDAISAGWFSSVRNNGAIVQVDFEGASFLVTSLDGTLEEVIPRCRAEFVADQRRCL